MLAGLGLPRDADAYICGPAAFMAEMSAALADLGVDGSRVHTEIFGAAPASTPGIAAAGTRPPHPPGGPPGDGPEVAFARSGLTVRWGPATAACSNWPKPVTCRSAGHAAPASATPARPA